MTSRIAVRLEVPALDVYSANERNFLEASEEERGLLLMRRRSFLRMSFWSLLVGGIVLVATLVYDEQIEPLPKFAISGVYFFWAMCVSHPFYQYVKLVLRPTPGSSIAWPQYWHDEGLRPGQIIPDLSIEDMSRVRVSTSSDDLEQRRVVTNLASLVQNIERSFVIPARAKTKFFQINR
jgi:hypothetical protein